MKTETTSGQDKSVAPRGKYPDPNVQAVFDYAIPDPTDPNTASERRRVVIHLEMELSKNQWDLVTRLLNGREFIRAADELKRLTPRTNNPNETHADQIIDSAMASL
jgi:hypothetical protein